MKAVIRHNIDLLLYTNSWVAICMAGLMTGFVQYHDAGNSISYGLFAFLATFTTYNFHRLVRYGTFRKTAIVTDRTLWLDHYRAPLIVGSVLSALGTIFLLFRLQFSIAALLLCSVLAIIVVFYAQLFSIKTLREWPGLKNVWIVLVWTGFLLLPILNSGKPIPFIEISAIGLLVYTAIIPFDIRDYSYDPNYMKTLPQLIGITQSRITGSILLLISTALLGMETGFQWLLVLLLLTQLTALWWKQTPRNIRYLELLWEIPLLVTGLYFFSLR
jgi:hypothetical protein